MSRASRLPKAEEPAKPEVNLEGILDRNLALEDEVRDLKQLLGRPITIQGQDAEAWRKFMDYMPQLTHLATNVSMTASAVQANKASLDSINLTLQRIATALEGGNVGESVGRRIEEAPARQSQRPDQSVAKRIVEHRRASARGVETDLLLALEDRHLRMTGERRGRGQAGDAAADDEDVAGLSHGSGGGQPLVHHFAVLGQPDRFDDLVVIRKDRSVPVLVPESRQEIV